MAARVWVAAPEEAEVVAGLLIAFRDHLAEQAPDDDAFRAGVTALLDEPETDFVLAAADEGPARAVAQLRFRRSVWTGRDCLLEDVFVAAEARGAGLGHALVAFALEHAAARGARRVELDVNEANAPALALYARLGFGTQDDRYGGRTQYWWRALD